MGRPDPINQDFSINSLFDTQLLASILDTYVHYSLFTLKRVEEEEEEEEKQVFSGTGPVVDDKSPPFFGPVLLCAF